MGNRHCFLRRLSWSGLAVPACCLWLVAPAHAAVLFTDNFDSGSHASSKNGVSWGDRTGSVSVSSDRSYSGNFALRFNFTAGGLGQDAFAEQRIRLPQRNEYWFRYRLYIPSNYTHRSDGSSNNKFLAVYRAPYSTPGFQVNYSLEPASGGGSSLDIHYYDDGSERSPRRVSSSFIGASDRGTWMEIVAQVKVPTSASSDDGVMKLWKNGVQIASITNLASWGGNGENYITEAYFLGWSNSGFSEQTVLFIDDVEIADTPVGTLAPSPPANVIAQ